MGTNTAERHLKPERVSRLFPRERERLNIGSAQGTHRPGGASGREPACQCRRHKRGGFNPWFGRVPGGGDGNPLQYSCLENSTSKEPGGLRSLGAWSRTQLSARAHVCVFQLSYNKKIASDGNSDSSGLGQSLHYPSASRERECPLHGAPPSVAQTPRTHARPHICKTPPGSYWTTI